MPQPLYVELLVAEQKKEAENNTGSVVIEAKTNDSILFLSEII